MENDIASFRHELCLTQAQLAQYLQTSVSTLGMAELGQRLLPTKALIQLLGLEVAFVSLPQPFPPYTPSTEATKAQLPVREIRSFIRRYRKAAWELKKDIARMERRASQSEQCIGVLQALQKAMPNMNAYQQKCLQQFIESAQYHWHMNAPAARKLCELQVTAYETMVAQAMQLLAQDAT